MARPVSALLDQGLVEFSAGARVDGSPAVLAVVLEAGDVGAEEGGELAPAARALALVTQLVVQHIWLYFHLWRLRYMRASTHTHTEGEK